MLFEEVELRLRFHALRDNAKVEALRELDDRAHDRRVLEPVGQVLDNVAIDLQAVDRETLQVAERRMAHAEVVDGDTDARSA